MYPDLTRYIKKALKGENKIPPGRKADLNHLAEFIKERRGKGQPVQLLFVCTQNSRRSQIAQIWAETAAAWFGLKEVQAFSGGTEISAFNHRSVEALIRAGFHIHDFGGENPRYRVTYDENGPARVCFSKKYDDPTNPVSGFAAVMVCSEADKDCPFVSGADFRIPIPYEDPKAGDGKPNEETWYDRRCFQIASEILYLMGQVK